MSDDSLHLFFFSLPFVLMSFEFEFKNLYSFKSFDTRAQSESASAHVDRSRILESKSN